MPELEQKEWEKINQIAGELSAADGYTAIRRKFLHDLNSLVSFDLADFCLTVKNGNQVTLVEPVVVSRFPREFEEAFTLKYEKYYGELDYTKWFFSNSESVVYRESDIVNNEVRMKTSYYRDYLKPMNLIHVAGVSLSEKGVSLGVAALYRTSQHGDFSDRDLYILRQLLPHLRSRMYAEYMKKPAAPVDTLESRLSILMLEYRLTRREAEVLRLVCEGKSNQEISERLYISVNTVKKHIGNLLYKMQAQNRLQLISSLMKNDGEMFHCRG